MLGMSVLVAGGGRPAATPYRPTRPVLEGADVAWSVRGRRRSGRRALGDPGGHGARRHRARHSEALDEVAPEVQEQRARGLVFHALGHEIDREAAGQDSQRAHDRCVPAPWLEAGDEQLVDLDLADVELAEVLERGE